jgi:hypothetical protein
MAMNDLAVREQLREALGTVRPLVTLSRDGLVLTALEWGVDRPATYETATAAARDGVLELREQGGGTVPAIEAVTKERPVSSSPVTRSSAASRTGSSISPSGSRP